jgi:hypothetical protein
MPWRRIGEWMYKPIFLDLGTSWRWVVSFTPRQLYPRRRRPRYPLNRRLGGPQSRSGRKPVAVPTTKRYFQYLITRTEQRLVVSHEVMLFAVRPQPIDPSYQWSALPILKQRWPILRLTLSPSVNHWPTVICWPGVLPVVRFVCKCCSRTATSLHASSPLHIWTSSEYFTTVLYYSTGV